MDPELLSRSYVVPRLAGLGYALPVLANAPLVQYSEGDFSYNGLRGLRGISTEESSMSYVVGGLGISLPGIDVSFATPEEMANAFKTIATGGFKITKRPDGATVVQDPQGNALTPEQVKALIEQARAEGAAGAKSALPPWALPAGIAALAAVLLLRK